MTSSALDTLIELATAAADEAAQRLGQALATAEDAGKKLELLIQYRDEYAQRFNAALRAGLSPAGYQNFRNFIEKLDAAISSQQLVVQQARQAVDAERGNWQASERKRMSFDTLATRAQKAAGQKASRQDQKQMDEHASRTPLFKR